jgi:mannitol-specific phosphotransferase system IIBC component
VAIDPVVGTLAGVLGGALIGFINNYLKRRWDMEDNQKKREWATTDLLKQEHKQMQEQKFDTYNKVLKTAGETIVVTDGGGGQSLDFNFTLYSEKIRPLLFEKFHVLDEDVRGLILKIDLDIGRVTFYEEASDEDEDYLANHYNMLLKKIDAKYKLE